MQARSFAESIERYADLCAQLDLAFLDRRAMLRAADLDESTLAQLQAHWIAQLITPFGAEIAARFATAYAATARLLSQRNAGRPAAADQGRLNAPRPLRPQPAATLQLSAFTEPPSTVRPEDEDTWPADALAKQRTAAVRCFQAGPVLPFVPAPRNEESGFRRASTLTSTQDSSRRGAPPPETTMQMPVFARLPPVLPFVPPRAPCRRLHRFDSRTGLPLANPKWVDDSDVDPKKPT